MYFPIVKNPRRPLDALLAAAQLTMLTATRQ